MKIHAHYVHIPNNLPYNYCPCSTTPRCFFSSMGQSKVVVCKFWRRSSVIILCRFLERLTSRLLNSGQSQKSKHSTLLPTHVNVIRPQHPVRRTVLTSRHPTQLNSLRLAHPLRSTVVTLEFWMALLVMNTLHRDLHIDKSRTLQVDAS